MSSLETIIARTTSYELMPPPPRPTTENEAEDNNDQYDNDDLSGIDNSQSTDGGSEGYRQPEVEAALDFSPDQLPSRSLRHDKPIYEASGTSYDNNSGTVGTTTENWSHYELKYGTTAISIKANGLPRKDLYERAFKGKTAAGRTAVEATDATGIARLATLSNDDDNELGDSQSTARSDSEREITWSATPAPVTPSRPSSQRPRADSSDSSTPRPKRPHRAGTAAPGRLGTIERAVTAILTSQQSSRRPIGADDTQRTIKDVQDRFLTANTKEEVEKFIS
ncbi:hypothetical protein FAVG1_04765 [Fusarium avenaceum]|nr:hypothetical protein FAVG1_04765 [Fusarium avenaceum]